MNKHRSLLVFALGALVSASPLGCGDDDDDNVGTLNQSWTIAASTDPNQCGPVGATQMRLIVVDSSGFTDATQFAPCTDFRALVSLFPDRYTGTATFLGADGVAVSRTLILPAFDIFEGQTTSLNIDFTVGDFLAR